ncbi:tetratricopeptide repeat protein [Actinomadura chibensis]|uniref:Tetratricopeptide repeat protein n=1 Tax=Actinomadura chibensis TaxID=392828 RepID=A0A5D0N9V4_9ACTN|nr:tetratricopeptide repeat protein [Actinomadura chibensis]TYB41099.1 tetratricopeptide repeat protein [Actinomadura chibensis]
MTLVLVLSDESSIYMSCDYMYTDHFTGRELETDAQKLVRLLRPGWNALVGFTGLGYIEGKPTGSWIVEATSGLTADSSFEEILDSLLEADDYIRSVRQGDLGNHSFIVASIRGSQALIGLVSNIYEIRRGQLVKAQASELKVSFTKPGVPWLFPLGDLTSLKGALLEKYNARKSQLELMVRLKADTSNVLSKLSALNAEIGEKTRSVSEGCHVAFLKADGTGGSQPFYTDQQTGSHVSAEFEKLLADAGLRLNPAKDSSGNPVPIKMISSSFVAVGDDHRYHRNQLRLHPTDSNAWNNYGSFLLSQGQRVAAESAYRKAIECDSNNAVPLANLAKLYWQHLRNPEQANLFYLASLRTFDDSPPSTWIVSDYACFLDECMNDYRGAEKYHSIAAADHQFPLAMARKAAFLFHKMGKIGEARDLMSRATKKGDSDYHILLLSSELDLLANESIGSALEKAARAVALAPGEGEVRLYYADLLLISGDHYSALHYYRRSMKELRKSPLRIANYGAGLLEANKTDLALKVLNRAHGEFPESIEISMNLGAALFVAGRVEAARNRLDSISQEDLDPKLELELILLKIVIHDRLESALRSRLDELRRLKTRIHPGMVARILRSENCRIRGNLREMIEVVVNEVAWPRDSTVL